MKARPVKLVYGQGYVDCPIAECTHVTLVLPGPSDRRTLPVILKGDREGTHCWSWNGSVDAPTLKPSVLSTGHEFPDPDADPTLPTSWRAWRCHTWVNDGMVQFLDDTDHQYRGQTLPLLDVLPEDEHYRNRTQETTT